MGYEISSNYQVRHFSSGKILKDFKTKNDVFVTIDYKNVKVMDLMNIYFPKSNTYEDIVEVPGYNKYIMSTTGRVFHKTKLNELKGTVQNGAYKKFGLVLNNTEYDENGRIKTNQKPIHQLMGSAFLEEPGGEEKKIVNHIDRIKTNNDKSNLNYMTIAENNKDAHKDPNRKPMGNSVYCIDPDTDEVVHTFESVAKAEEFIGKLQGSTKIGAKCKNGGGYCGKIANRKNKYWHWKYVEEEKTKNNKLEIQNEKDVEIKKKHGDVEWKQYIHPILGTSNYEVSSDGRVRNATDKLPKIVYIRSYGGKYEKGRCEVKLTINGKQVHKLVHIMVATMFVLNSNPKTKIEVNHIDENPQNNHYSNLEWVTPQENMVHSFGKMVDQMDKNGNILNTFITIKKAAVFINMQDGQLGTCCQNEMNGKFTTTCGGFRWQYNQEDMLIWQLKKTKSNGGTITNQEKVKEYRDTIVDQEEVEDEIKEHRGTIVDQEEVEDEDEVKEHRGTIVDQEEVEDEVKEYRDTIVDQEEVEEDLLELEDQQLKPKISLTDEIYKIDPIAKKVLHVYKNISEIETELKKAKNSTPIREYCKTVSGKLYAGFIWEYVNSFNVNNDKKLATVIKDYGNYKNEETKVVEEWKLYVDPVFGETKYEVLNTGRIRERGTVQDLNIIKFNENDKNGAKKICNVHIWYTGEKRCKAVSLPKIIATMFVKNPKNGKGVDHIDKEYTNIHYTNLQWTKTNRGGKSVLIDYKVIQYSREGVYVKTHLNFEAAAEAVKRDKGQLRKACNLANHKKQAVANHVWEFEDYDYSG
jgi:hypothetical protein